MNQRQQGSYERFHAEREEYVDEIRRYESEAITDPAGYLRRVRRFVAVGYAAIFVTLAVTLGAMAFAVGWVFERGIGGLTVKLLLVLGAFAFVILRALLQGIPRPEGVELSRQAAPDLYRMVDEVRAALNAPPVTSIVLTEDFNAAAHQRPKWGLLGPRENSLILGLPYLWAVTPEELRATVAHELGHFSGSHSAFAGTIYRLMNTWGAVWENARAAHSPFTWFLNWYMPKLDALTFALRRQNEYEADAAAVRLASARANATDLFRFAVHGRYLATEVWRDVYSQVDEMPAPPNILEQALAKLRQPIDEEQARAWMADALEQETGYTDTHPSTRDRLAAMGLDIEIESYVSAVRQPPARSAAEEYLGDALSQAIKLVQAALVERVGAKWAAEHESRLSHLSELANLQATPDAASVSRRAELKMALGDAEEALRLYGQVLAEDPDDPDANFEVGMALAKEGSTEAERFLVAAAVSDEHRLDVYRTLFAIFDRKSIRDKAAQYFELGEKESDVVQDLIEHLFADKPEISAAELTHSERARMTAALNQVEDEAEAAYAVRVQRGERTLQGLFVVLKTRWYHPIGARARAKRIFELLDESVSVMVRFIRNDEGKLKKRLKAMPEARIWP